MLFVPVSRQHPNDNVNRQGATWNRGYLKFYTLVRILFYSDMHCNDLIC